MLLWEELPRFHKIFPTIVYTTLDLEYYVYWHIHYILFSRYQLLTMTDERRVERDLFAVIGAGIVHGFFTIPFIVWLLLRFTS